MDILLLVLLFTIIAATGYILSKPFLNQDQLVGELAMDPDFDQRYYQLLQEIKAIEENCISEEMPDDLCSQVEALKKQAADLLKQADLLSDRIPQKSLYAGSSKVDDHHPGTTPTQEQPVYCSKCGSQIINGDKFCVHCGQNLKP